MRIETTEHFAPKQTKAAATCRLIRSLRLCFEAGTRRRRAFVIEADGEPLAGASYTHYERNAISTL